MHEETRLQPRVRGGGSGVCGGAKRRDCRRVSSGRSMSLGWSVSGWIVFGWLVGGAGDSVSDSGPFGGVGWEFDGYPVVALLIQFVQLTVEELRVGCGIVRHVEADSVSFAWGFACHYSCSRAVVLWVLAW